ncbi:DNA-methyltransferase [Candidatus Darwinibacter acetoxidans]
MDAIITDPPYGYLDHKLDKYFDNQKFFELAYRLVKKDGFLIFFGRGVENARRMVIAEDVGFKFKEEIVWNKKNANHLFNNIARVHEMVYVFTKGDITINKVKKSFLDEIFNVNDKDYIDTLKNDISCIVSKINSINTFEDFVEWKNGNVKIKKTKKYNINGYIKFSNYNVLNKYNKGAILKSIINVYRNHLHTIHPTEKPVKLMEILIELVDDGSNDFTVLDPFAGSCSQAIACYNLNKNFIGCEIDKEYYDLAVNRIYKECLPKLF